MVISAAGAMTGLNFWRSAIDQVTHPVGSVGPDECIVRSEEAPGIYGSRQGTTPVRV
jgi:hypothetical protein